MSVTKYSTKNLINFLKHTPKDILYNIFRYYYEYMSYIWLDMGLYPKINYQFTQLAKPLKTVSKLPDELIQHISEFIPYENYPSLQYEEIPYSFWFNTNPNSPFPLNTNTLKSLTGSGEIITRSLYQNGRNNLYMLFPRVIERIREN